MSVQYLSTLQLRLKQTAEALVVVNSIAYNTNYAVDFLRDGEELNQVKVSFTTTVDLPDSRKLKGR